jgi:uridine nucleosidase
MSKPTPIWLDCDTGHDDAFAILLAALHPDVKLLGISTIFGNAPLSHTTINTLAILKALGLEHDIPVYAGASHPFCRPVALAPDIHGESGLDGTSCLPVPDTKPRTDDSAVGAMFRALSGEEAGTPWLVCTGALTNAALMFAVHPEMGAHIGGLTHMGGAIGGGFTDAPMGVLKGHGEEDQAGRFGNWTPFAEFNVYIDPESARAVLGSPVIAAKTTICPLDLTHQLLATESVQADLLHGLHHRIGEGEGEGERKGKGPPSQVRKLFVEILTFFAQTYADVFGLVEGPPLHDPLAVAAAFVPEIFEDHGGERFGVEVVTEGAHGSSSDVREGGSQCGRTVATVVGEGMEGVRIPRSVDRVEMWRMIDECLARAESAPFSSEA